MIQAELLGRRRNGEPFYGVTLRDCHDGKFSLDILYQGTKIEVLSFLCGMLTKIVASA